MRISESMVRSYLRNITMGRAANLEDPLSDLSAFDAEIDQMGEMAAANRTKSWLKIALATLLAQPQEAGIERFAGQGYPFDENELVRLFTYAFERLWPETPANRGGEATMFEIVQMDAEEWETILADTLDDEDDEDDDDDDDEEDDEDDEEGANPPA